MILYGKYSAKLLESDANISRSQILTFGITVVLSGKIFKSSEKMTFKKHIEGQFIFDDGYRRQINVDSGFNSTESAMFLPRR